MKRTISNSDDIIDSRDVIKRIEELENERAALADEWEAYDPVDENKPEMSLVEWDDTDEGLELRALSALAAEARGYASDWPHGAALIRDSYFEDYARQFAEDIGAIKDDAGWPNSYIDWEQAADALKQDYTSVDFDGVTYWIRS